MNLTTLNTVNASSKTSENYLFINTNTILNKFLELGYEVKNANESKPRKLEKIGYQTHSIELINRNLYLEGEGFAKVILRNNHWGEKSFQISVGFFRIICSNGLVIGNAFYHAKIQHVKQNEDELNKIVAQAHEAAKNVLPVVAKLKSVNLNENQVKTLHNTALNIRGVQIVDEKSKEFLEDRIQANINPTRPEDDKSNLWGLLNILQEKIINGGLNTVNNKGQFRMSRKIKSIDRKLLLNKQLFDAALSMAA
jgi:hypothetical protein